MTRASLRHQRTSFPTPHRLRLLAVFLFPLMILLSCAGDRTAPGITLDWEPIASLLDGLPDGISVYEGHNGDIPLKAWYVRVEPGAGLTARVTVSADTDQKENVAEFAGRTGAVVAVNGGYFRMDKDPARHVGLLYIEGTAVEPSFESILRGETRYPITRATFGITPDGRYDIAWVASRNDSLFEWGRPPHNTAGEPAQPLDFLAASLWVRRDALAA